MRKLWALIIGSLLICLPSIGEAGEKIFTIEPALPSIGRPLTEPGGFLNPYEGRRRYDGSIEISTPLPAPGRSMEPGSPLNPLIIRPVR